MRVRWERWLLPALVYYSCFFFLPYAIFIRNSFYKTVGAGRIGDEFTLANYTKLLTDSFYLGALWDSVYTSGLTVVISLVLAAPVAYYLARSRSRWTELAFTIMFVSSLTSTVIRGMGMLSLLGGGGPINRTLIALGLVDSPIKMTNNLTGAVLGLVHYEVPYMVLLLMPVILAIEPALEEAAAGLGASRWTTIRRVLVPLAAPGLIAASLLVFAMSLGAYTTPSIVGGARLRLYPLLIYQQVNGVLDYAMGAALAFILMVLALFVVLVTNLAARGRMHKV